MKKLARRLFRLNKNFLHLNLYGIVEVETPGTVGEYIITHITETSYREGDRRLEVTFEKWRY